MSILTRAAAVVAFLSPALSLAQEVSIPNAGPKWGAHLDLEGKGGTDRNLGEADLFLPLAQTADTLLFGSIRARLDDDDSREGNYGLGVRHMLDSGWNIGGYGYFDRRRSEYGNHFHQVTLGAEALSMDWDLRANYYAPVGRTRHLVDTLNTAEISGSSVVFRGGEERALGGFDGEIGWRVPLFDASADRQLRIFGGAYHFSESGVADVTGPRARAELTFDSVPYIWEGSRFSIGAEWQHDDPRGSQGFLAARLRIPLQSYGKPASTLTPMERRMADPVVRDIDVVAQAGTFSPPETVTAFADGTGFTVISASPAIGTSLTNALAAAGTNATVILTGTFNTTSTSMLQAGQTLLGGGSLQVKSASGRTATLTLPSATLNMTNTGTGYALNMANDSTVRGLTVNAYSASNSSWGIRANNVSNVVIANNTISATTTNDYGGVAGIYIGSSSNVQVTGNTVTALHTSGNGTGTYGIRVDASGTADFGVTISDNIFKATTTSGDVAAILLNANQAATNIIAAGSGNTILAGDCSRIGAGTVTGALGLTGGATCP